eukprot:s3855_g2.t1
MILGSFLWLHQAHEYLDSVCQGTPVATSWTHKSSREEGFGSNNKIIVNTYLATLLDKTSVLLSPCRIV